MDFLALAISSQDAPTTFATIYQIADGIHLSVPNEKEMRISLTWLINNELVRKLKNKYSLTQTGKEMLSEI